MAKKELPIKEAYKAIEKEVVKARPKREEEAKELVQLVVFEIDEEEYAVDIGEVREIMKMTPITSIPNSPAFIGGIINVRGDIAVVIDLEKRFNLVREHKPKRIHIILSELGETLYGLIVDEVTEVLRIPKEDIEPAPGIISERIQAGYVKGIGMVEDRLLIVLDFKKVLAEKALSELGRMITNHAKKARAKIARETPEEVETKEERREKAEEILEARIKEKKVEEKKIEEKPPARREKAKKK